MIISVVYLLVRCLLSCLTVLDLSARLIVTGALTGVIAAALVFSNPASLKQYPAWLLVAVGLFALSGMSYRAAIESAFAHGQDIQVALDLYRDRVLEGMRMPEPRHLAEERQIFKQLCEFLGKYSEDHQFNIRYRERRYRN